MEVRVEGLVKAYGRKPALSGLDLRLGGGLVCLIGLNGAGKSTLLGCLAGLLVPTAGQVRFDGARFSMDDLALRRRIAWLPDQPFAYAEHKVIEHIAMVVRAYQVEVDAAVEARLLGWLEEFGMLELAEERMGQLSRGQHYKAGLIAQMAVAPELWLLDEPFASGMDPRGLAAFRREARARVQAGGTVVYSTQILEIAARFCDRMLVLDGGKLVADLTKADLEAMPETGPGSLEERFGDFKEQP
ncbi:ABC transporter ATP-binding protein [Haloferula sargassicola]|uniref:ABC-type transporter ATP-binding protein EcsA n=1 Tax=Haloferula sargassicola TaxID=490096 RepID=A0ABP9UPA6_9BACT